MKKLQLKVFDWVIRNPDSASKLLLYGAIGWAITGIIAFWK